MPCLCILPFCKPFVRMPPPTKLFVLLHEY
uniref:Uncharacterized protein n=1 Tax=Arundo donax TaxID=35708 RepID=A0A0A8YXL3_ARUDO